MQHIKPFGTFIKALPQINKYHPRFAALGRGTAILQETSDVEHYLGAYATRHLARLEPLLALVDAQTAIMRAPFQTVDWGCGTLLATLALRDQLTTVGRRHHHKAASGLDASPAKLVKARTLWTRFGGAGMACHLVQGDVNVEVSRFAKAASARPLPALHLAANFLDLAAVDQRRIGTIIGAAMRPGDVFLAVSPTAGHRLEAFRRAAGFGESLPTLWPTRDAYTCTFLCVR